ncbi:hypothetical protein CLOM_g6590 [Closterium sp. NIES-68]|nr:hypothetical protein CLOM_g11876 [Closterium sp. NIES-68]GJP47398.1 hypothetical protein CLOM_g6590 [Closterium sp. NIES-68]GJP69583.1 hypothetical protein CLOP_g581 [Closterium sp. NIES-67]
MTGARLVASPAVKPALRRTPAIVCRVAPPKTSSSDPVNLFNPATWFGKSSKAQPEPVPEPELEPLATLPPTPVFPSHQAMTLFLQSYARLLQHVKAGTVVGRGRRDGVGHVDLVDHSHDAMVSGDSLAAAGETVLERVHLGLGALLHHPQHGVQGGTVWGRREEEVEKCLAELEKDVEHMRDAHEKAPPATTLNLATAHALDAAKMISKL